MRRTSPTPIPGGHIREDEHLRGLEAELKRTGVVVVPHRSHLCIRLPLFTSVLVTRRGDELELVPQIGPFRRATTLVGTAVAATGSVAALGAWGEPAMALTAGVGGIALMLLELAGLVLAEGCATRVRFLWAARLRDAPTKPALETGTAAPAPIGRVVDDPARPPRAMPHEPERAADPLPPDRQPSPRPWA